MKETAFNSFAAFPANSRVWIFASDRPVEKSQEEEIRSATQNFLQGWTAHEQKVHASVEIAHEHFLIIMVNESETILSGCGTDKLFHFIQELGKSCALNFLDRMRIQILQNEKVESLSRHDVAERYARALIHDDSIVFNNAESTKSEFDTSWQIRLVESWIYKSLKSTRAGLN